MTEKMYLEEKEVAIIGGGRMGTAITDALAKIFKNIKISEKDKERQQFLRERYPGFINQIFFDNPKAVEMSDVIILAVRPEQGEEVLCEIAPALNKNKLLVSIMGGTSLSSIHKCLNECYLDKDYTVIRVMPNICAIVGQAITGVCTDSMYKEELQLSEKNIAITEKIFRACGETIRIEESKMPGETAIGGCAPAIWASLLEASQLAGIEAGLNPDDALFVSAQSMKGVADMVLRGKVKPREIIEFVCTPGGITIKAVTKLEHGTRGGLISAFEEATEVSS